MDNPTSNTSYQNGNLNNIILLDTTHNTTRANAFQASVIPLSICARTIVLERYSFVQPQARQLLTHKTFCWHHDVTTDLRLTRVTFHKSLAMYASYLEGYGKIDICQTKHFSWDGAACPAQRQTATTSILYLTCYVLDVHAHCQFHKQSHCRFWEKGLKRLHSVRSVSWTVECQKCILRNASSNLWDHTNTPSEFGTFKTSVDFVFLTDHQLRWKLVPWTVTHDRTPIGLAALVFQGRLCCWKEWNEWER